MRRWWLLPVVAAALAAAAFRSSAAVRLKVAVSLFGWRGLGEVVREGFAARVLGRKPTHTRTEWLGILEALDEADKKWLGPGKAIVGINDIAEGHKALGDYFRTGWDWNMDVDPARPVLKQAVSPDRKALGDNPDAFYYLSNLHENYTYVMRGRMTGEAYFSIAVHTAPCEGCFIRDPPLAEMNDRKLTLRDDGSFEVLLSAQPRPAAYSGAFVSLAGAGGDPLQLLCRHYYERELSVMADPHFVRPPLTISLADPTTAAPLPSPPTPAPTEEDVARGLRAVKMFIKKHTTELERDPAQVPKWFSFVPHQFGDPNDDAQSGGGKAIDISYSAAPFKLAPDEAFVIDGVLPRCAFANLVLWNRFLQSFNYVDRRTSLNRKQIKGVGPGGQFRIVLAHRDPGVPNWVDTMGREGGTLFWRFLLPEEPVVRPNGTVMKFADISSF